MHSMAYNNKNARRACSSSSSSSRSHSSDASSGIGIGNDTNGRASTARGCHTRDCPFEIRAELFSITLWSLLSALCNTRTLLMWVCVRLCICLSVLGCLWIRSKIIKPVRVYRSRIRVKLAFIMPQPSVFVCAQPQSVGANSNVSFVN